MTTILIRDVPDDIHAALASSAEKNRRSKEKQALFLIESGLRRKKPSSEVLAEARRLHEQFKGEIAISDVMNWTEAAH